ncbi:hypothetical protein HN51_043592 [Arachis hypogaea]|uniref:Uncharacterized protein n=1 Tax=Arachis hypogaea TaxID=3818 RepID=A0A444Y5W4_ARAHY|nr:uncharacterized protein LOC110265232 [Arachis ipaensis]XP_025669867.1 uncharacterized protein LOC112769579 [Arachis hypogaea]QHN95642.1 uncharacterized protein DS421_18g611490 [Arachis hypogaea]RYQ97362.1 hypothetical protein Ahy_B08g093406 [Arachis hypogaea]
MEEENDTPLLNANGNQPFANLTHQEPKTRFMTRTLKPVPFKPSKNLNFARHEKLLRRIGLWDFAHLEFDRHIRVDLIEQLVDSYEPSLRCGYVNGVRVSANRTQLGIALKLLPLKEEKGEIFGQVLEGLDFAESVQFLEEFMWNWMVLDDDDDDDEGVMVMPDEVLECESLIREGHFGKVDWVGLIWSMVEREMREVGLVKCYYASHLQLLIQVQCEELLKEVPLVIEVDDEFQEHNTELSSGNVKLQKKSIEGDEEILDFGLDDHLGKPILLQCDVNVNSFDYGKEKDDEEYENDSLELNSERDFISSQDDLEMTSGSLFVGKGHKRAIELDYDNTNLSLSGNNKKLRIDNNPCNNAEPVDFDACMARMQDWMGKAALMYATKNRSCEDSAMSLQNLLNEIQNRDNKIEDLRRTMVDERKKGQMNLYRLQKELDMMASLLEEYRKALRETHKAFAEYRAIIKHKPITKKGQLKKKHLAIEQSLKEDHVKTIA